MIGSGNRVHIDRFTNEMKINITVHQSSDLCDIYVHADLKFDKIRENETEKCAHDYDIYALSNCFAGLSHHLSDNANSAVLHSFLKHMNLENQLDTLLRTCTTTKATCIPNPLKCIINYFLTDMLRDVLFEKTG